jgi:hypothetical protein
LAAELLAVLPEGKVLEGAAGGAGEASAAASFGDVASLLGRPPPDFTSCADYLAAMVGEEARAAEVRRCVGEGVAHWRDARFGASPEVTAWLTSEREGEGDRVGVHLVWSTRMLTLVRRSPTGLARSISLPLSPSWLVALKRVRWPEPAPTDAAEVLATLATARPIANV